MAQFQCKHCGNDFHAKPSQRRQFCSRTCYAQHSEVTRICPTCKDHFITKRYAQQTYCSPQCHHEQLRQLTAKSCQVCGTKFSGTPSYMKDRTHCSRRCAAQTVHKEARQKRARPCLQCGKRFTASTCYQQFCSRTCASRNHARRIQGEKNPRYLHGKANLPYPTDWLQVSRRVRDRDGHTCVICSTKQGNLDVHHIDMDKSNNAPENLISLCRPCHMRVHKTHDLCQRIAPRLVKEATLRSTTFRSQTTTTSLPVASSSTTA